MRQRRLARVSAAALILTGVACSAGGGDDPNSQDNGSENPGPGVGGSSGGFNPNPSPGGGSGTGGGFDVGDAGGNDCQSVTVNFEPKIPTVYLVVDASDSVFAAEAWEPLRDGVLQVVNELQAEVRFGFTAFTGPKNNMCPYEESVNPEFNNFEAISEAYMGFEHVPAGNTPTQVVLESVGERLEADRAVAPGDKFILFVTDGEPDFCDNGEATCPIDAVNYQLQQLYNQGIRTLVMGLRTKIDAVPVETLQNFANAGAGQPVGPMTNQQGVPYTALDIYDRCNVVAPWRALYTASGVVPPDGARGRPMAEYAEAPGEAHLYRPDATNASQLVSELRAALSGVKSCTFDLQGGIEVDLTQLGSANIKVDGETLPLDQEGKANGWYMETSTQLKLAGSACDRWQAPEAREIYFGFPCEVIIR